MILFDHNSIFDAKLDNLVLVSGAPSMGITAFMLFLLLQNTTKKPILFISTDKSEEYLQKRAIEISQNTHTSALENNLQEVTFLKLNPQQDGTIDMSQILKIVQDKNIQHIFIDGTNVLSQTRKPQIKKDYFSVLKNFAKQYVVSILSSTPLKRIPPGEQSLFHPHIDLLYMKNAALSHADSVLLLHRSAYYHLVTDELILFHYDFRIKLTKATKLEPFF
jgi:replicative DNA helicase